MTIGLVIAFQSHFTSMAIPDGCVVHMHTVYVCEKEMQ